MPGFLIRGRGLVGYMAFDRHYSLFPMSPGVIDAHREELGDFVTGKGTISFEYGRRLPVTLVKKVGPASRRSPEAVVRPEWFRVVPTSVDGLLDERDTTG
jgi:hypothetical protein